MTPDKFTKVCTRNVKPCAFWVTSILCQVKEEKKIFHCKAGKNYFRNGLDANIIKIPSAHALKEYQ
jgi:hypothetical protein